MHATIDSQPRPRRRARPGATVVARSIMGTPVGEPIVLDRRRRRLATVVAHHADQRRPFVVSRHADGEVLRPEDHTVVLPEAWAGTWVSAGETVLITYLPLGGGGSSSGQSSGKQIGSAVAMLALMAVATVVAPGIGNAAVAAASGGLFTTASAGTVAAIQAGLVIGGAYAISLATRAKADSQESDTRAVYGVSGGGNLPRPGDRIPVGYGRFWTQPDLTQPDYTIYDGEDQILYKRMTLGLGKYDVEEIHVGTAVLWTQDDGIQPPFDAAPGSSAGRGGGSDIAASSGTGGAGAGLTAVEIIAPGGSSTLVPGSVYSHPSVTGIELPFAGDVPEWSGPWAACEVGDVTTRIQLDYELPQGCANNGAAEPFAANWSVQFQYATCDEDDNPTSAWSDLHANGGTIYATRAVRFTRFVTVASGRYLVRAKNGQAQSDKVANTVTWSGLRTHFPETITRPHVTEIALRIRSGKALGITAFGNIWVRATRILPVWSGSAWVEEPTRKCVYAYRDVLMAGYGGSLDGAMVDDGTITARAASVTTFDTYDGLIRGPVSVWEVGNVVLGPMRAEPAVLGSLWSLVRDESKSVRKHVFTRRQIRRGTSMAEFAIARDAGEADVIVEYNPDADPRRRRDARITFGAQSLTPRRQKVEGVASWDHAVHLATWLAAAAYHRRQQRTFTVDRQGRIVSRGDPILADCWFLAEGTRTGGVMSADGTTLTLDTPMDQGGTLYAYLRDRRGREWGPVAVTVPDAEAPHVIELDADDVAAVETAYSQTLAEVLADDDEDMTTAVVGPLAEIQERYLVRSVRHAGRDTIEIETRIDAPEVWTALAEPLPAEPAVPSIGDAASPAYPTVPWVRARCIAKATNLEMEWACGTARGASSYVVMLSYDSGATWEAVSDGLSTSGSYALRHVEGASVKVAAWALGTTGGAGPAVYSTFTTFSQTVGPSSLVAGLREYVTEEFKRVTDKLVDFERMIAAASAEQDAANWFDKKAVRNDILASSDRAEASISEVETVAVNANLAVASLSATVTATFAAQTVAINQTSTAIATVDGKLLGTWQMAINADGYVSGMKAYNDGTTSAFVISADVLQFGWPGSAGPTPVFQIANVAGAAKLAFRGDMFADGTVTARTIVAGSINSDKIAVGGVDILNIIDGAVTGLAYQVGSDVTITLVGGTHSTVVAGTTLLARKGTFAIDGLAYINAYKPGAPTYNIYLDILIDGAIVKTVTLEPVENIVAMNPAGTGQVGGDWFIRGTFAVPHVASVSLTTHTIQLAVRCQGYNSSLIGSTFTVGQPFIRVMELRR